jgi:hypothetical protein
VEDKPLESQVPGFCFDESFASMLNNASFRIMLIYKYMWWLEASIINVETAFSHGESTGDIYMSIPGGMSEDQDHFLQLKKTIYG